MEEHLPTQERDLEMDVVEIQIQKGERITLADLVRQKGLILAAPEVPAYGRIALEGSLWAKWIVNPSEFSEGYLLLYPQAGGGFQAIVRVSDDSAGGKLTYLISEVCRTHPGAVQDLKVRLGLASPEAPQKSFANNLRKIRSYTEAFAREGRVETRIDDVAPIVLAHPLLNVRIPSIMPSLGFPGAVVITKTDNPYYLVVWPSRGGCYQGIGIDQTTGQIVTTEVVTNLQDALTRGYATALQQPAGTNYARAS